MCTQPLDRTFASAAFHLGLLVNLDKLEAYLEAASFFKEFGRNYKFLRRQFSKKKLTETGRNCDNRVFKRLTPAS